VRIANGYVPSRQQKGATRATLRIVNDNQEVDFYFRLPGQSWQKTRESLKSAACTTTSSADSSTSAPPFRRRLRQHQFPQLPLLA